MNIVYPIILWEKRKRRIKRYKRRFIWENTSESVVTCWSYILWEKRRGNSLFSSHSHIFLGEPPLNGARVITSSQRHSFNYFFSYPIIRNFDIYIFTKFTVINVDMYLKLFYFLGFNNKITCFIWIICDLICIQYLNIKFGITYTALLELEHCIIPIK